MTLSNAQSFAAKLVPWLASYCERIEVAGSVRRLRPVCNDIDLVCIPKLQVERDMLGAVTAEHNLLWAFLNDYIGSGKAAFKTGGSQPGKFAILQLRKCQLDVFFATPETFATRLLCRTGSKEHNIWFAQRCLDYGMPWKPYEGVLDTATKKIVPSQSEADLYAAVGVKYIEPQNREPDWIKKHLEFNL